MQLHIKAIRRSSLRTFRYLHFRHWARDLPFLQRSTERLALSLVAERGSYRQLLLRSRWHSRESLLAIHQIADVQHEVGCHPGISMNVRHRVEQAAQLRMLGDVFLDVLQPLASGLQCLLELQTGFDL